MRRFLLLFFSVLTVFLCIGAASAETADALPAEIRAYFNKPAFEGMTVLSTADGRDIGGKDACYFVLIRKANHENVLVQFKLNQQGQWQYSFAAGYAVPQTRHDVQLALTLSGNEWPTDEQYAIPHLSILQIDEGDEYPELCVTFELKDGKWLLHRVWSYTDYDHMLIQDGAISYYRDIETNKIVGTARGTIQRDLRYFSLSALPKTLKEAKNKLTSAPALPSGGLSAQEIQFTGGKTYNVYAAPDQNALRGGSGKAKVSTNGWIQVFGKENGWILIQYSIDSGHYRFGYISADALPKKAAVPELDFGSAPVYIAADVSVTDDPLFSRAQLATLREGTNVTLLSRLGEDAYIEAQADGKVFRGFVPFSALKTEAHRFSAFTDAQGRSFGWFVVTKLLYGSDHKVYAVQGHYERPVMGEEYETSEIAAGSETIYPLADDFHASMLASMTDAEMTYRPVTDLYAWYIDAYVGRDGYDGHELVFASDLTEAEREGADLDFWFVTTRIELNEQGQIRYMEYVYVPWG